MKWVKIAILAMLFAGVMAVSDAQQTELPREAGSCLDIFGGC